MKTFKEYLIENYSLLTSFTIYHGSDDPNLTIEKIKDVAPRALGKGFYGFERNKVKGKYIYEVKVEGNFLEGQQQMPYDLLNKILLKYPKIKVILLNILQTEIPETQIEDLELCTTEDILYSFIKFFDVNNVNEIFKSFNIDGLRNLITHNFMETVVYNYQSIKSVRLI